MKAKKKNFHISSFVAKIQLSSSVSFSSKEMKKISILKFSVFFLKRNVWKFSLKKNWWKFILHQKKVEWKKILKVQFFFYLWPFGHRMWILKFEFHSFIQWISIFSYNGKNLCSFSSSSTTTTRQWWFDLNLVFVVVRQVYQRKRNPKPKNKKKQQQQET